MDELSFWKSWNNKYKWFLGISSLLLIASAILFALAYIVGDSWYYQWDTIKELESIYIPTGTFIDHFHEFSTSAYNYVVFESFNPDIMQIDEWITHTYLAIIFLSLSIFTGLATTFKRTYFYASMLLVMVVLALFNLDLLEIAPGRYKPILGVSIILYIVPAYMMFAFYSNLSVIQRISMMLLVSIIMLSGIFLLSPMEPHAVSLMIVGYGSMAMIPISLVFIAATAIEPVSLFLFMNGQRRMTQKKGGLLTFTVSSLLYVILVLLIFLNYMQSGKSEFGGVDVYLLLLASAVIGFWDFRKRFNAQSRIQNLQYTLLYIVLGAIGLSTIGYALISANSPLIKVYNWSIAGFFLCFGASFLLYVLINFYPLILNRIDVYKVVFKPLKIRTYHMWIMAAVAVLVLELRSYNRPFYRAIAAYYNYLGDAHLKDGELDLAREYYSSGKSNSIRDHRSNYCKANINILQNKYDEAAECYDDAIEGEPSVHAYVSKANIYNLTDQYFKALFTIEDGLKTFPNDPYLLSNKSLLLQKASLTDSALLVINQSLGQDQEPWIEEVVYSNALALALLSKNLSVSKALIDKNINQRSFQINKNAYHNLIGARTDVENPFRYGLSLDKIRLAEVVNYGMNKFNWEDTLVLKNLKAVAENHRNAFFNEDIYYVLAHIYNHNGDFEKAMSLMSEIANSSSPMSAHFSYIFGHWFMQQKKYNLAEKYFRMAVKRQPEARYNLAFVSLILNKHATAYRNWDIIERSSKGEANRMAKMFKKILTVQNLDSLSDDELFNYFILVNPQALPSNIYRLDSSDYYQYAEQELISMLLEKGSLDKAEALLSGYDEDNKVEPILYFKAKLNQLQGKHKEALQYLKSMNITSYTAYNSLYLKAFVYKELGEKEDAFRITNDLLRQYPFHVKGILLKAEILNLLGEKDKSYDALVDGLYRNEKNPDLLKAYAIQCLEIQLISYAEEAMQDLKELLPLQEYQEFEKIFLKKKQEAEEQEESWE